MVVPSFRFLLFALAVAALYWLVNDLRWRRGVLLVANLVFVASFVASPVALLPFGGFLLLGAVGVLARRRGARWAVWAAPTLVLLVFVWLKRYSFVPQDLLLAQGYFLVGLSYVFFRVMHLVIDGWEGMPKGVAGWISYFNYTLNFTSLVSGPIQRYEDYMRCELPGRRISAPSAWLGVERTITGFFKVYIVSVVLHLALESEVAAFRASHGSAQVVHGAALVGVYPAYLYFNFSGYTDFVIGIARLLHIELPENFDRPFRSCNFISFWGRWHISLSTWLKTYVYNTSILALMRRIPSPKMEPFFSVTAYFLTFFLVGLWHGQTSEFLFFGVLQGGGVSANKLYQICMTRILGRGNYSRLTKSAIYAVVARGLTITWFAFTLLWFWSSWSQIRGFVHSAGAVNLALALALLFAVVTIGLEILDRLSFWVRTRMLWGEPVPDSPYVRLALALDMIAIVAFTAVAIHAPPTQIVYQAF